MERIDVSILNYERIIKKGFDLIACSLESSERPPDYICFSLSLENFGRHDILECPTHERTPLAGPNQLVPRNRIHKFEKAAIEIRISLFSEWTRLQALACELLLQTT